MSIHLERKQIEIVYTIHTKIVMFAKVCYIISNVLVNEFMHLEIHVHTMTLFVEFLGFISTLNIFRQDISNTTTLISVDTLVLDFYVYNHVTD